MVLLSFILVLCNRTKSLQHCLRLPTTVGIQPLISYKQWTPSHYPHQTTICSDNFRPCRTFSSAHGNKSCISCRNSSLPPKTSREQTSPASRYTISSSVHIPFISPQYTTTLFTRWVLHTFVIMFSCNGVFIFFVKQWKVALCPRKILLEAQQSLFYSTYVPIHLTKKQEDETVQDQ